MAHKRYKEMMMYAEDAAEIDEPWLRWQFEMETPTGATYWADCSCDINWLGLNKYRRKPKTININGYDVPEPVREPLRDRDRYFCTCLYLFGPICVWCGDTVDQTRLDAGIIHLTKEAAILHSKALLSLTENKDV